MNLLTATSRNWLDAVLGDFNRFLSDHAAAEKKASGMALSLAAHYADQPAIVSAMADLAVEEISHYREVVRLMLRQDIPLLPDGKDDYVRQLNRTARAPTDLYRIDRLLIAAVVEARGHERFGLIAQQHPDSKMRRFYRAITSSEQRHYTVFLDLAAAYTEPAALDLRLRELLQIEAGILDALPVRAALH